MMYDYKDAKKKRYLEWMGSTIYDLIKNKKDEFKLHQV